MTKNFKTMVTLASFSITTHPFPLFTHSRSHACPATIPLPASLIITNFRKIYRQIGKFSSNSNSPPPPSLPFRNLPLPASIQSRLKMRSHTSQLRSVDERRKFASRCTPKLSKNATFSPIIWTWSSPTFEGRTSQAKWSRRSFENSETPHNSIWKTFTLTRSI